jgi:PAS domain S-box-containing protein
MDTDGISRAPPDWAAACLAGLLVPITVALLTLYAAGVDPAALPPAGSPPMSPFAALCFLLLGAGHLFCVLPRHGGLWRCLPAAFVLIASLLILAAALLLKTPLQLPPPWPLAAFRATVLVISPTYPLTALLLCIASAAMLCAGLSARLPTRLTVLWFDALLPTGVMGSMCLLAAHMIAPKALFLLLPFLTVPLSATLCFTILFLAIALVAPAGSHWRALMLQHQGAGLLWLFLPSLVVATVGAALLAPEVGGIDTSPPIIAGFLLLLASPAGLYHVGWRFGLLPAWSEAPPDRFQEEILDALERSATGMVLTDADGTILNANLGMEALFGWPVPDLLSQSIDILMPMRFRARHREHLQGFLQGTEDSMVIGGQTPMMGLRRDGVEFPLSTVIQKTRRGEQVYVFVTVQDQSGYQNKLQAITDRAYHDALTGAKNRRAYEDLGARAVERARRDGVPLAYVSS